MHTRRASHSCARPLNCGVRRLLLMKRGIQIGFVLYWLVFVLFTVRQGQYPGSFDGRDVWSYPYQAVAQVCLLLTLFLAVLYVIVPAGRFPYSWRRLLCAVAYAV